MHFPQLIIIENDGRIAGVLRDDAVRRRWVLKEARRVERCSRLLGRGDPNVVLARVGGDLVKEMTLFSRIQAEFPEVPLVGVTDVGEDAWVRFLYEMGAVFVITAPWSPAQMVSLATGIMERLIARKENPKKAPR